MIVTRTLFFSPIKICVKLFRRHLLYYFMAFKCSKNSILPEFSKALVINKLDLLLWRHIDKVREYEGKSEGPAGPAWRILQG